MSENYSNIEKLVNSVFGSSEWQTEGITVVPSNFQAPTTVPYIQVNTISSGGALNTQANSGVVIIDIYIDAGKGVLNGSTISDTLDLYLRNKTLQNIKGTLQLSNSSLSKVGLDPTNPNLYRLQYSLSFNYFGIL